MSKFPITNGTPLRIDPETLSQEDALNMVKEGQPILFYRGITTPYILVYGTLKLGYGNWHGHLKDRAEYIETVEMPYITRYRSISASWNNGIEGVPSCVMDLFKVKEEDLKEVDRRLDILEGGYEQILFPMEVDGEIVPVKFYHQNVRDIESLKNEQLFTLAARDRAIDLNGAPERAIDFLRQQGITKKNTPNLKRYIDFYVNLSDTLVTQ